MTHEDFMEQFVEIKKRGFERFIHYCGRKVNTKYFMDWYDVILVSTGEIIARNYFDKYYIRKDFLQFKKFKSLRGE